MFKQLKSIHQLINESLSLKNSSITPSLSKFYTLASKKWSWTRNRPWPEFDHIRNELDSYRSRLKNKPIVILELGCGDWRFAEFLDNKDDFVFHYIWIDCSVWLIDIAKSKWYTNKVEFYVWDMLQYMNFLEQESIDIIVSIASIQHLHKQQRHIVWNESYRILRFQWKHISINRSYSSWILKKHRKSLFVWCISSLINRRTFWFGDAMIPFTEQYIEQHSNKSPVWISLWNKNVWDYWIYGKNEVRSKTSYRFYHFFTLRELRNLIQKAWLVFSTWWFISKVWQLSDKARQSRNSFVVWTKDVVY